RAREATNPKVRRLSPCSPRTREPAALRAAMVAARGRRPPLESARVAVDPELVVDLADAEDLVDHVLDPVTGPAILDAADHRDLAALDLDLDVAGVDLRVGGE